MTINVPQPTTMNQIVLIVTKFVIHNSTSASPTIQHSKLNIQHSIPHPTDGTRRAILRWGTIDSIIT